MQSQITAISTTQAPAAVGPYSQAVCMGDMIFVSGQIPVNPETKEVIRDDFPRAVRQVLDNIKAILEAAASDLAHVLRVEIFMTDLGRFQEFNAIYAEYFAHAPQPARQTVQVQALPLDVAIEISCIAVKGS